MSNYWHMKLAKEKETARFMEWLIANHPEIYDEYDWERVE